MDRISDLINLIFLNLSDNKIITDNGIKRLLNIRII